MMYNQHNGYRKAPASSSTSVSGCEYYSLVIGGLPDADNVITNLLKPVIDERRNFLLLRHDPSEPEYSSIPSEYDKLHHHIICALERSTLYNDQAWTRAKDNVKINGGFFKSQKVFSLKAFVAYLRMPGKIEVLNQSRGELREAYENVTKEDIEKQVSQKFRKRDAGDDINSLRSWIFEYNVFSETELMNKLCHLDLFQAIFKKYSFSKNFDKAKSLCSTQIINSSFEELSNYWETISRPTEFYSIAQSVEILKQWCTTQSIDFRTFIFNVVTIIDKRKRKVNCLYFLGESNGGKTYIARSLQNLCRLWQSVASGSSRFIWQDCISKRLIVINEPVLDETVLESCKEVFEGLGAFVAVKMRADQYLSRTPIIITSNWPIWQFNPSVKDVLMNRIIAYQHIREAPFLKQCTKDLHPGLWAHALDGLGGFPALIEWEIEQAKAGELLAIAPPAVPQAIDTYVVPAALESAEKM